MQSSHLAIVVTLRQSLPHQFICHALGLQSALEASATRLNCNLVCSPHKHSGSAFGMYLNVAFLSKRTCYRCSLLCILELRCLQTKTMLFLLLLPVPSTFAQV